MSTQFITCPAGAFHSQISPTAYKVFLALKSFDGKDHKIFPSKKTLAEKCGLGMTSIYKALKQLTKAGLVSIVARHDKNGRQTSNFYQIHEPTPAQHTQRPNWFSINKKALESCLSPVDLKVYSCLARHADHNGQCFPSRKQIAEECRLSVTTVYRAVYRLQYHGFLSISSQQRDNGGKRQNLYTLLIPQDLEQADLSQPAKDSRISLSTAFLTKIQAAKESAVSLLKNFPNFHRLPFPYRE
ncbi:MAG: hypothetical protein HFJ84_11250 [Clostridiales bacterium]|nr:hypothetical protein [Clostridiales bacterium]